MSTLSGEIKLIYLGIHFGTLLLLFAYNLLLYLSVKDRALLFYSLFIFLTIPIEIISFNGERETLISAFYPLQFILPMEHIMDFLICSNVVFFLLYAKSLLDLNREHKYLTYLLNTLSVFMSCSALYYLLASSYSNPPGRFVLANPVTVYSVIVVLVTVFALGIKRMLNGYKPARIFVSAMTFLFVGQISAAFGLLNFVRLPDWGVFDPGKVGNLIFNLLLAFAIGNKINLLKKEKLEAQEKALEVLEEKVQQRTFEVVHQKKIIEDKNKDIMDSIRYAQRIQRSLLPTEKYIDKNLDKLNKG